MALHRPRWPGNDVGMRVWIVLILLALAGCKAERRQLGQALSGQPPVISGSLIGRWRIVDLNGGGGVPGAMLAFEGTSITGSSGCNRITGSWTLDGARLAIGPLASTRMACAAASMALEQRFLALLSAVQSVQFDANGNATLISPDGRRMRLAPALPEPARAQ